MFVVSFTSIPPRFAQLPRVIAALQAQTRAPDRIFLTIPRHYRRFPGAHPLPDLPGVEVIRPDHDPGPAGKILLAAKALRGQDCDILYCDDDCEYAPGWVGHFLSARQEFGPDTIIAGSGFDVHRLGLARSQEIPRADADTAGHVDIAQGYSGVLIRPDHLDDIACAPPQVAWPVDDIWLSGSFARLKLPIWQPSGIRALCHPINDPDALQHAHIGGATRDQSNKACVEHMVKSFGIWG